MKKISRGIVLITSLLLVGIIVMIASLLLVSGRNTLLLGASFSDKEQAYYAAECGLAYIQFCISRFTGFCANDKQLDYIYNPDFDNFYVEIVPGENKCIHGVLNDGASEFYAAFYDGSWSAIDLRNDNGGTSMKYYSVNNLMNTTTTLTSIHYNGLEGNTFRTVPPQRAHIIVEGRCNKAKRYVESMIMRSTAQLGASFSVSAGGMDVGLTDTDSVFLINSASGTESKLRSLNDINVYSGSFPGQNPYDKNCFQIANNGKSCTGSGSKSSPLKKYTYVNGEKLDSSSKQQEFGLACENSSQSSYISNSKLSWKAVTQNYIENDGKYSKNIKATLNSGAWIYKNTKEEPNIYNLFYYPQKFETEYAQEFVNSHIGFEYSKWEEEPLVKGSSKSIVIKDNVDMSSLSKSGGYLFTMKDAVGIDEDIYGNTDFAVAIYDYDQDGKYKPSTAYRASVRIEGDQSKGTDSCFITKKGGNIFVGGELSGKGKVLCGGNISFQGKSMLESDRSQGVSLYSQGTVTINPVEGLGGSADPNDALKTAISNLISAYDSDGTGYYKSNTDDYKKLTQNVLNTKISGTFGCKTYSAKTSLSEVLGDSANFNYDTNTSYDLVSALLSKNTYIGEDISPPRTVTNKSWNYNATTINGYYTACSPDYNYRTERREYEDEKRKTHEYTVWVPDSIKGMYIYLQKYEDCKYKYDQYYVNYETGNVDNLYRGNDQTYSLGTTVNQSKSKINEGKITLDLKSFSADFQLSTNINDNRWEVSFPQEGSQVKSNKIMVLDPSSGKFVSLSNKDTLLKGLIYTWEDLYGPNLQGGSFTIRGAVIAYGGDPETDDPGTNGKGKVILKNGKNITLTYDPDYLHMLLDSMQGVATSRIFHATF